MKKLITLYEIEGSYLIENHRADNYQAFKQKDEDVKLFNRVFKIMGIKDLRVIEARDYARYKVND